MAENDHKPASKTAAAFKARSDEMGPYSLPLPSWRHGHGAETKAIQIWSFPENDSAEGNMPDYLTLFFRQQRKCQFPMSTKDVDEIRFGLTGKCPEVDRSYCWNISCALRTNHCHIGNLARCAQRPN